MKKLFFLSMAVALTLLSNRGMAQIDAAPATPDERLTVQVLDCVRQSGNVLFTFLLRNDGADLSYLLECDGGTAQIVDNLGNTYRARVNIGDGSGFVPVPTGVPIKVTARIDNVASDATGFPIIRLSGRAYNANESYNPRGDFTFRNIAIK